MLEHVCGVRFRCGRGERCWKNRHNTKWLHPEGFRRHLKQKHPEILAELRSDFEANRVDYGYFGLYLAYAPAAAQFTVNVDT